MLSYLAVTLSHQTVMLSLPKHLYHAASFGRDASTDSA